MTTTSALPSSLEATVPDRGLDHAAIVVTGAAGGIGAATCARLCAEGARVVAVDREREALDTLAGGLPAPSSVERLAGDVTDAATADAAVALAMASFGRLDGVVCIAGA